MDLARPLRVIAPTLQGDVLGVLAKGDRVLTGRAVAREIGNASVSGVQRALDRLVSEGIILRENAGRAYLYRLNREHLAARWIEGLASLRLQLIERLIELVGSWETAPVVAVLFGSAARAETGSESDLDILIVRPRGCDEDDAGWREQLMELESSAAAWTGNDARVLEFDEEEIRGLAASEAVIQAAASEGIELYGSRRLLRPQRRRRS
jgi:DNA-binding transcriptional regulator YhcF (GntR family)